MIQVRSEQPLDAPAVRMVNEQAFGQPQEADVVDKLRRLCMPLRSLVAVDGDRVVGHILFSPATAQRQGVVLQGMGLAPMAVLPQYQRQGIGSMLVQKGIAILRASSCPFIIVLGARFIVDQVL